MKKFTAVLSMLLILTVLSCSKTDKASGVEMVSLNQKFIDSASNTKLSLSDKYIRENTKTMTLGSSGSDNTSDYKDYFYFSLLADFLTIPQVDNINITSKNKVIVISKSYAINQLRTVENDNFKQVIVIAEKVFEGNATDRDKTRLSQMFQETFMQMNTINRKGAIHANMLFYFTLLIDNEVPQQVKAFALNIIRDDLLKLPMKDSQEYSSLLYNNDAAGFSNKLLFEINSELNFDRIISNI